jgi:hypothetical protein
VKGPLRHVVSVVDAMASGQGEPAELFGGGGGV